MKHGKMVPYLVMYKEIAGYYCKLFANSSLSIIIIENGINYKVLNKMEFACYDRSTNRSGISFYYIAA